MRLFEIKEEFENLFLTAFDEETGELTDPEAWASLEMAEEEKLKNTIALYKNLVSDANELKAAGSDLIDRAKRKQSKADTIKKLLDSYLEGRKYECTEGEITYRKSTSTEQTDEMAFLEWKDKFLFGNTEFKPDKTAIKTALKEGKEIPGWTLVEKNNIGIK